MRTREYKKILGYASIMKANFSGKKQWWWNILIKIHASMKSKITMWLVLNNKLLTWKKGLNVVGSAQVYALCANLMKKLMHICLFFVLTQCEFSIM